MFEFLFKYRPVVFERGDFSLAVPGWAVLPILLGLALAVALALRYRKAGPALAARDRWMLGALRTLVFAVLVFALLRPTLVVSTVVPRRNHVALLLDDSRSMRIADDEGRPRGDRVLQLFGGVDSPGDGGPAPGTLGSALEERFRLRPYAFDSDARRIDSPAELGFRGERTDLGRSLRRVLQELEGLPVSGVVLVTDGANNADTPLVEAVRSYEARGLPIYTIGIGAERIAPDLELRRVELPRRALEGTTIVADVMVSHSGLAGRTIRLEVEDEGRLLATRELELGPDGEVPVQIQFTLEDPGPRDIRFAAVPQEDEAVTDNNARSALLDVTDEAPSILYFEGTPRPELKFLRRAVRDDGNLRLVALLRSADEKFLRLGVEDADELAAGFPTTREELFRYAGLVLGDVEASFFTHDQLQMVADFVGQRGGGLLVLGGRRALGEGGYAGTPLADALPVLLDPGEGEVVEIRPRLTPAGRRHPAIRIAGDASASEDRWSTLPPLTTVNRVTRVKPGAVTLLSGVPVDGGEEVVLLAHQRYGRGTAIAFATQDTWLWQMHAEIPVEDQTHETLWKQLLRWLVHDAPARVRPELGDAPVPPGEPMTVRAVVEDERYLRVNGAGVTATVTAPDGTSERIPLVWTVEGDGEYEGRFVPPAAGLYRVAVDAIASGAGGGPVGEASATTGLAGDSIRGVGWFRAGAEQREAFGAGRRTDLLRRIADETGGRFYTADEAQGLAEDIRYTESGDTLVERRPLWDMPILLVLLAILLTAEWSYRRYRELP